MGCREELDYMDDRKRLRIFGWASGILFSLGWWVFIDAVAQNGYEDDPLNVKAQLYLLGVGTTLSFIMLTCMDWSALAADEYSHHGGLMVRYQTRAFLGFAVVLGLFCIITSIYVLHNVYVNKHGIGGKIPDSTYPGVAILFQCLFIFGAAFVLKLGRTNDDYL
ncbi:Transmembrane protein 50B [Hondaea fermentalgiana]|uniref:Transmembrane protein 50B n=1 Tax=Hondaea fermentalgiana TaxID=2315210 RepID=A0A2R5G7C9_9STRA|nr:Transmembrane protein 50B [Hondaea fermentalgiana]|eukprot:GBG25698.1 Transmembrane protein 50B [Hondaea fermentalgiana]